LSRFLRFLSISLGIVVLDQIVKLVVKFNMDLGEEIRVLGSWFKIYFIENKGAAFGVTLDNLAGGLDPITAKLFLTLFSVAAVSFIAWYLFKSSKETTGLPIFLAMILGGAVGNIIDRVFYGYWFEPMNSYEGGLLYGRVVDMFYVDMGILSIPEWVPLLGGIHYPMWPVFNVADSAISIGIVAIFIFHRRFFPEPPKKSEPQTPETKPETSVDNPTASMQTEASSS